MGNWSPRLESNQYPTLRRHVHYPLCYGEDAHAAVKQRSGKKPQDEACSPAGGPRERAGTVNRAQL